VPKQGLPLAMPKRIDTPDYWMDEFRLGSEDMDALYGHALDAAAPLEIDELAVALVRQHVERLTAVHRPRPDDRSIVYLPSARFEEGQRLVFPALGAASGVVEAVRPGNNPAYGDYSVIRVRLGDRGPVREFASAITWEHALTQAALQADPEALAAAYAPLVAPRLADELQSDREWASFGNRWVLRALLPKVDAGHRNLAEAVVMLAGEPLPTGRIADEIDLAVDAPPVLRAMALDIALQADGRFRNVGAHESPLWALKS